MSTVITYSAPEPLRIDVRGLAVDIEGLCGCVVCVSLAINIIIKV